MCKRKERTNLHIYVCVYAYMYQISKSLEFLNFSVSKQKNIYIYNFHKITMTAIIYC